MRLPLSGMPCMSKSLRHVRVSSAANTSAEAKISNARKVMSRADPKGVATRYNPASNFSNL